MTRLFFRPLIRRSRLFAAFVLAVNISLVAFSGTQPAHAWTCTSHCYGSVDWPGATWGTWTNIYVKDVSLPTANQSFLTQELWLVDTNVNAWAEIGYYMGNPNSNSVISYFYAYVPPGGSYSETRIAQVPTVDKNKYTSFKITRNNQTTSTLLLAAVSVGGTTNFSVVINNNQGGSNWAGNHMIIGSELYLTTDSNPSSSGDVRWKANKWQTSSGTYVAQTSEGNMTDDAHQDPSWETSPAPGNDGGTFKNSCCSLF